MCDLIQLSSVRILAVVKRLYAYAYAAPILCEARRDLALERDVIVAFGTK